MMTMSMNDTTRGFGVHNLPNWSGGPPPALGPVPVHSPWHSTSIFLSSQFLVVILAQFLGSSYPGVNTESLLSLKIFLL